MKIGILTLPMHGNYGGILQAYALQTVLKRMGHKVVTFDPPRYVKVNIFQIIKKIYLKYILKKENVGLLSEIRINREAYFTRKYTQPFVNKHISRAIVQNLSEISGDDYDAIVAGSDQVWRPRFNACIENSYLAFTKGWNVKRIAYAASFGTEQWEYSEEQTKNCSALIQSFDAVSVREDAGVRLCSQYLGYDKAVHVLDPTMLLSAEDYMELIKGKRKKKRGDLFCYMLDETGEKDKVINLIAAQKNLKPFKVNSKIDDNSAKMKERIQPPIEQWLRGFMEAKCVVTDSFHGCVFSIIFNKPFWVIGNFGRGMARFTSLLKMFRLEDRLLSDDKDYSDFDFSKPIDWDAVNVMKKEWQRKSENYLRTALKDSES